jgi:hypothetical protein
MDIVEREKKRRKYALYWTIRSSAVGAIATYYHKYIYKEPCMTNYKNVYIYFDMKDILH